MRLAGDGSTNRALLEAVADWQDHPAWLEFMDTYNPMMVRWCRGYGLSEELIEEVCQRIWIELAERMKTFEYDPSRTFRGWLRRLCESRVLDFLRQRRAAWLLSLDEQVAELETIAARGAMDPDGDDVDDDPRCRFLMEEGEKVQSAVRARVKTHTWEAFWLVAVCDWSVERTAQSLRMTHTAVYCARDRVARMLCDEGKRVSDGWTSEP